MYKRRTKTSNKYASNTWNLITEIQENASDIDTVFFFALLFMIATEAYSKKNKQKNENMKTFKFQS